MFGLVYCIWNGDQMIYVGSTIISLERRMMEHKSYCNNEKSANHNFKIYKKIREVGFENCRFEILFEDNNFRDKDNLRELEDFYYLLYSELYELYNDQRPKRSQKEYRENNKEQIATYKKEYYEDNKEIIAEQNKQYRENNKEIIAEQKKQYYENNKEIIAERNKQWRENNKEKIKQYDKERNKKKYDCECGSKELSLRNIARHNKSKKHLKEVVQ